MMISLDRGGTDPMNQCSPEIPKACGLLNKSPMNPKVVTTLIDWNVKHRVGTDQDDYEALLGQSLPPHLVGVFINISSMILVLIGSIRLFVVIIQGRRMRMSTTIIWMNLLEKNAVSQCNT